MVTFCSNNRGLLWLSGRGGWGINYIMERCLHISKSYVSCLGKSMTLYFIYLLISWSHSSFHLFDQKSENRKKTKTCCCRDKFRGIFVLFLPCTLLYSSTSGEFYLYMCKRPIKRCRHGLNRVPVEGKAFAAAAHNHQLFALLKNTSVSSLYGA